MKKEYELNHYILVIVIPKWSRRGL